MKDENVSIGEFERFMKIIVETQGRHSEEFKEMNKQLCHMAEKFNETIVLLREDHNTSRTMVETHMRNFDYVQRQNHKTFISIDARLDSHEQTFKDRADFYGISKIIVWCFTLILSGALLYFGTSLAKRVNLEKAEPVKIVQEKVKTRAN